LELKSRVSKVFHLDKCFCPRSQKHTSAQVWVRIFGLAQEYWHPKILIAIASGLGTPIITDPIVSKSMFDRTFGQYARVLVDIDMSQTLNYQILVERK